MLQQICSRLLDIAKGAALMTGTTYEVTGSSGDANIVSNDALGAIVQKNLEEVGGYSMSETERKFASDLQKTLNIDSHRPAWIKRTRLSRCGGRIRMRLRRPRMRET